MNGSWNDVALQISKVKNQEISFKKKVSVSGGCINQCWKVTDNQHKEWFIKTNLPTLKEMFSAESAGLNEIIRSNSIRAPKSICYGSNPEFSYHVIEFIPLQALSHQKQLGEEIAKMHQTSSNQYGWVQNNTIGSTPQLNQKNPNWITFWKNERLLYQLNLALKNGFPHKTYDDGLKLSENISCFFTSYQIKPSLLHGDLWAGNIASDSNGNPVIFDPAVYFGDRETDIAMTELFGGFNKGFYTSYNHHFALDQGYKTRKKLYNLYHILNHYNLFKGGYASQANGMIQELLSQT